MVCGRCIMVVKSKLEKLGLNPLAMQLGEVEIKESITKSQKDTLAKQLLSLGFELIDDKKSKTIEKIKNLIVELVHYKNNELQTNLSGYLSTEIPSHIHAYTNLIFEPTRILKHSKK